MKGEGVVATVKKSKLMGKLKRSGSSKSSKLTSTQKKATSKPSKLTFSSATQQKLVISTSNGVVGAEMMEQQMKVVSTSREIPPTPKPSDGGTGKVH